MLTLWMERGHPARSKIVRLIDAAPFEAEDDAHAADLKRLLAVPPPCIIVPAAMMRAAA